MLSIMETVTQQGGTATTASPPGFTTAGKTGTAQKMVGRAYSHSKYNSVFMGLIPAQKPVLAITVIIEEPKGAIYGGVVAAPIFREIAGQALRVLGYYPQPNKTDTILTQAKPAAPQPAPHRPLPSARKSCLCKRRRFPRWNCPHWGRGRNRPPDPLKVMPNLEGMTIRRAVELLHRSGVRCRLQGSGLAVSQDPPPGTPLKPGSICVVKFEPHFEEPGGGCQGSRVGIGF
jgi:cell division protein FtsI (penicillin-binding protein 3)